MADHEELKENLIALLIVLVVVGGGVWWVWTHLHPTPQAASTERVNIPVGLSPSIGSENASVTVIVFSDFECPFCGEFARTSYPTFKQQYIDTGKARLVFKQFPLDIHPHAAAAAQASLCAEEQQKFWEYHDVVYAHQEKLEVADLKSYAQQLGMNMTNFDLCMSRPAMQVGQEKDLGLKSGVSGTPTFFINGRKVVGLLSAQEMSAEVEKELNPQ